MLKAEVFVWATGSLLGSCTEWYLWFFHWPLPCYLQSFGKWNNCTISALTDTGEGDAFCQILLFCFLPCWSGCFPVSLVVAYKQTQARWLKSLICVKICVRNREVKGSKYHHKSPKPLNHLLLASTICILLHVTLQKASPVQTLHVEKPLHENQICAAGGCCSICLQLLHPCWHSPTPLHAAASSLPPSNLSSAA